MTRVSLIAVSLVLALSACKKQAPVEDAPDTTAPARIAEVPKSLDSAVAKMRENFQRVHFALDSYSLDEPSQAALLANVQIMQVHPDIVVEVQGHADERGTTDYNLALGDRRATAVQKFMVRSGVAKARIVTVSYGEEVPRARGSDESAWSENRRAEFRVLTSGADDVAGTLD